jgi:hypothetical protein
MTSSDVWGEETAARCDADSAEKFAPDVLDPTVHLLARLAGSGAALEFAIGTGRVAVPLAARGVPVAGIDLPGGRFVIELRVPPLRRLPPGQSAVPMGARDGHLVLDTCDVISQQGTSHHYWHDPDSTTRYGASRFRYIWPAECDLMAQLAHVSVWRRPWHEGRGGRSA